MKSATVFKAVLAVTILTCVKIFSQTDNFDIQAYKNFLKSHENMTSAEIFSLHPAGTFKGNLNQKYSSAVYYDSATIKYKLTASEKSLIEKNGFMVTERYNFANFKKAFSDIYYRDMPVFITTDAILDALHKSYDKILKDIEIEVLVPKLTLFLKNLHEQLPALVQQYKSAPEMDVMLKDLDVYITVARKLLDQSVTPYYSSNESNIADLLKYIGGQKPLEVNLFSSTPKIIDFSQFTPRGHYVDQLQPQLANYFRAMIWLGRIEIYLSAPRAINPKPSAEDIQRQTILAELVVEAVEKSNSFGLYEDLNGIIQFFVGESDNVTLPDIKALSQELKITKASELLDTLKLKAFQDTLKNKSYAFQRILSQIIETGFDSPDSIIPASAFLLLGQRFIIDSYITSQVVFDKVKPNGQGLMRMLPSSQDVLFALGNNASAQLLKKDLETFNYGLNLSALRYLTDSYGSDFWTLSLYNMWLNAIRKLNPPEEEERSRLPLFMQTGAFWQQKMNTQLSSWAQLRHDNLLYAKQSYSGGITCSFPFAYVEPFPEFYSQVKLFAEKAKQYLSGFSFKEPEMKTHVTGYFSFLAGVSDTLANISAKELNNTTLTETERTFLKNIISYTKVGCGDVLYDGWYPRLLYASSIGTQDLEMVVADIHTAPTDAEGNPIGWVLHVGTGPVNLGVFMVPFADNTTIACVGPVMSYYENLKTGFKRLTDQEWQTEYTMSSRPNFVNSYLATNSGEQRPAGASLLTGVEDNETPVLPESVILVNNYPNPFNSSTVIKFTIPESYSHEQTRLTIYNIQGEVIRTLINEVLPSGNYLARWDGTNRSGTAVTSGVYLYNLVVGGKSSSGKMTLLK